MISLVGLTTVFATTVSFSSPPERLELLLPKIGEAIARPLKADPLLAQEVVVVHVKEVEKQALLDRIATVVGAEWREVEGVQTLLRPPALRSSLTAQAAAERANRIRAALLKNAIQTPFHTREVDELANKIRAHNARIESQSDREKGASLGTLINAPERMLRLPLLAAALPWETMSGTTDRVVFSDRPNGVQVELPAVAMGRLADTYLAHRTLVEANQRLSATDEAGPYRISEKDVFGRSTEPPVKAIVAASTMPAFVSITLALLDANGKVVRFGAYRADPRAQMNPALDKLPSLDKSFRLTGDADLLFRAYQNPELPVPRALLEKVVDPLKHEPLATSIMQGFLNLGEDAGLNVLALVPDYPTTEAATIRPRKPTSYREFLSRLASISPMRYSVEGKWLHASPQDREHIRKHRTDRRNLAKYLGRVAQVGALPFDELATFAYGFPMEGTIIGPLLPFRLQTLFPLGRHNQLQDWQTVRLWGSLPSHLRQHLLRGGATPMAQLPETTRSLLTWLAARSEWGPTSARTGDPLAEPTEMIPNGLQKDAQITVEWSSQPQLWPMLDDTLALAPVDTWDAVMLDAEGKSETLYHASKVFNLEFQVRLAPLSAFVGSVKNHVIMDLGQKPTPLLRLPRPFLKELLTNFSEYQWESLPRDYSRQLQASAGL